MNRSSEFGNYFFRELCFPAVIGLHRMYTGNEGWLVFYLKSQIDLPKLWYLYSKVYGFCYTRNVYLESVSLTILLSE